MYQAMCKQQTGCSWSPSISLGRAFDLDVLPLVLAPPLLCITNILHILERTMLVELADVARGRAC